MKRHDSLVCFRCMITVQSVFYRFLITLVSITRTYVCSECLFPSNPDSMAEIAIFVPTKSLSCFAYLVLRAMTIAPYPSTYH